MSILVIQVKNFHIQNRGEHDPAIDQLENIDLNITHRRACRCWNRLWSKSAFRLVESFEHLNVEFSLCLVGNAIKQVVQKKKKKFAPILAAYQWANHIEWSSVKNQIGPLSKRLDQCSFLEILEFS